MTSLKSGVKLGLMKKETITFDIGKYVGEVKNGKQHGQGTFTFPDGATYVGQYKDGKRHGQGTFTATDGRVMKGIWENDELVKPN